VLDTIKHFYRLVNVSTFLTHYSYAVNIYSTIVVFRPFVCAQKYIG